MNEFFGGTMLGSLNSKLYENMQRHVFSNGGARRDLEDLRAAIGHHAKENLHHAIIRVTLPEKGKARERWLTRSEAAQLLWTCWRYREEQTIHRGKNKGQKIKTAKKTLQHVARFILIGLYTGTRAGAIATASPVRDEGRSYVDLDNGIFYRLAQGKRTTKKRQPAVKLPKRLLAHMRRWHERKIIANHFEEWNGISVASVKVGFASAVQHAKRSTAQGNITPHTLRHTAATWLMQRGVDAWQAAGFLGMSTQVLIDTYGHHHPNFMQDAANAITRKERIGDRIGDPPRLRALEK
ncbi:tyrosine-type recombinase/integrase [Rhodopseudomonas sp. NSM]|uniref:tyrosine-type recombinase/integrase n=1 Tax=Rhodopseudomonas sp. NSM TaxID=3457630 RepID=UPI004035CDAB